VAVTYTLVLEAEVHAARTKVPAHIRPRIRQAIDALAHEPRPARSRLLDTTGLDIPAGIEIWRLRLESWRVVYAISDDERWVWILGLHRRPPYDYADLPAVIEKLR
jgi:mRNA interferase RelE/StbE